jgi:hypothetical protein
VCVCVCMSVLFRLARFLTTEIFNRSMNARVSHAVINFLLLIMHKPQSIVFLLFLTLPLRFLLVCLFFYQNYFFSRIEKHVIDAQIFVALLYRINYTLRASLCCISCH